MIRLDLDRSSLDVTDAELLALRADWAANSHVRFPGFFSGPLLARAQSLLETSQFTPKAHEGVGQDWLCENGPLVDILMFLLNDAALFGVVRRITDCGEIGCFQGRVYRMDPRQSHHEHWHDDLAHDRLLALSVNLSDAPYRGGTLCLRRAGDPASATWIPNTGPGDAVLFRLDPSLEHYISDVEPGPPKTAWAGWFRSRPAFKDILLRRARF